LLGEDLIFGSMISKSCAKASFWWRL